MQDEQQPATPAAPDVVNGAAPQTIGLQQLCQPLYQARGWIKLLAVLVLISGVLQALTCVGILFAWLPIWMGVLLLGVARTSEQAYAQDDPSAFLESMTKLRTYFTLMGVVTLIGLILGLVGFIAGFVIPLVMAGSMAAFQ